MTLKRDLLDRGMELRETHISLVFLSADRVYKVKKPVELGFLDFRTLEARERFCEAEVELNRRLAPSVYLGVLPIVRDPSGVHHIGASGEPIEWAVEMRRLADAACAERWLKERRLSRDDVRRLAEHLSAFHSQARCDGETTRFGSLEVIEKNVRENFEQTRTSALRYLSAEEFAELERWQLSALEAQRALFEARMASGRVRDGHGDLRLEHCYIEPDGKVQIIDCIEFNERFRYADVCADIAFLSMDLAWHGRHDLSEDFLAYYARAADDYELYGLVDFYASYRAHVRAKVSSMLEEDGKAQRAARERAAAHARKYYVLAEACTREPLEPAVLYAVGGVIASGKSTLAEQLAALIHAPIIDSDRTRKRLLGVDPLRPLSHPPFSGAYGSEMSARTYDSLFKRAELVLRSQRPAIIDASFRESSARTAALALARRLGVRLVFIECYADPDTIKARLHARAQGPAISDGRAEIFDAFAASYEPVTELPARAYQRIDTTRSSGDIDNILRAITKAR
jgi:uncharacterized protein